VSTFSAFNLTFENEGFLFKNEVQKDD